MQVWTIIGIVILSSLTTCGIRIAFEPNMIFHCYKLLLDRMAIHPFIKKPLGTCTICMASFYGVPIYWYISYLCHSNHLLILFTIPIVLPVMGFINGYLMNRFYND